MWNIPRIGKSGLCNNFITFENYLPVGFSHILMTFPNAFITKAIESMIN